jgi:hypothetical protein
MSEINQAAEDLFFKLRNRFPQVKMGDENGTPIVDPENARFFSFLYTDKESKRPYGDITCSLISGDSLKVFFDTAITERMLPEDKSYWYMFLRELRRYAKSHMLNFDVRDITKDTLSRQDYKYMQTLNPEKKKMKESLEESRVLWQRRGKISEGDLNNVRIHVVHNEKMLENTNNRLLKVDRIYLVNESGEKFLLPFKSISGAKAMANHVSRGGNPYDPQGQLIGRAVNEMRNLGRFVRTTNNKTFEAAEAGNVIKSAIQMKESIKRHLNRLSNNSRSFSESLTELANLISETPEDLGEVKGWFTQQTYNENLDNYLASAAGAYKRLKENAMTKLSEAAGAVEQKILDPNFKLVLRKDSALDKLMVSRQYTDKTALLSAILGDIANRLMAKDGDDVANFASLMGDLISSEGEAFAQTPDKEYARDKKLAIVLAQKYMKDLGEVVKNPEYAATVRVEPNRRGGPVNASTEADEFEESIMSIGEAEVEESGLQYYTGKKKYGKDGMEALAKAGRDGASQEELGRIRDKYMKEAGPADAPEHADPDADDKRWDDVEEAAQKAKDARGVDEVAHDYGDKPVPPADDPDPIGTKIQALDADPSTPKYNPATSKSNEPSMFDPKRMGPKQTFEPDQPVYKDGGGFDKEFTVPKEGVEMEGNEFSGSLAAARAAGKKSFEVDGKTYPVRESLNDLRRLAGLHLLNEYNISEAPPVAPKAPAGGTVTRANAPAASQKFQGTIKDFQRLNPGATVGQAMNAIQGKTAIKGGNNDPAVIQARNNTNPPPGKSPVQAFDPNVARNASNSGGAGLDPATTAQAAKPSDRPTQAAGTPQASLDAAQAASNAARPTQAAGTPQASLDAAAKSSSFMGALTGQSGSPTSVALGGARLPDPNAAQAATPPATPATPATAAPSAPSALSPTPIGKDDTGFIKPSGGSSNPIGTPPGKFDNSPTVATPPAASAADGGVGDTKTGITTDSKTNNHGDSKLTELRRLAGL